MSAASTAGESTSVPVSSDLYRQLQAHAAERGSSVQDVVNTALRSFLGAQMPTTRLSSEPALALQRQVSMLGTPSAALRQSSLLSLYTTDPIITLVDGLIEGEHTIAQALTHGNFGLGTLDRLDGEVVVLDGVAYHQREGGETTVLAGSEVTPFMTVTWFDPAAATSVPLTLAHDIEALQAQVAASFRSENVLHAIRITGHFSLLKARGVCKQPAGTRLAYAAAHQALFELQAQQGELVGFWCPPFMGSSLNVPGFHWHFISADRRRGGHVLQLALEQGVAQVLEIHRCTVDMPFRDSFLQRRLETRRVSQELHAAEVAHA